jgi:hypothetical protein
MKFSMTGQEKCPFNTGDCLIEVTAWAGLTVHQCHVSHFYFDITCYSITAMWP